MEVSNLSKEIIKCDVCGLKVSADQGDWLGDIYSSPFLCNLYREDQLKLDEDCDKFFAGEINDR